jgi:hypothetical protein
MTAAAPFKFVEGDLPATTNPETTPMSTFWKVTLGIGAAIAVTSGVVLIVRHHRAKALAPPPGPGPIELPPVDES